MSEPTQIPPFHGSYLPDDGQILLKPIDIPYTEVARKEALIQAGTRHYSEMLVKEYQPSPRYLALFHAALARHKRQLALHAWTLAHLVADRPDPVLVSLARAGTPVGVLLRRILRDYLDRDAPHYSISIIRDRGVDGNALKYILKRHGTRGDNLIFVDGWTGKGVIGRELRHWVTAFNQEEGRHISPDLYVLTDISGTAQVSASLDDYLIPSSLLNATISGLISRSILNEAFIGPEDFHGCKFYPELAEADLSLNYLEILMAEIGELVAAGLPPLTPPDDRARRERREQGEQFMAEIRSRYGIDNINLIKPGIGEAIRVLLRRVPEQILVRDPSLPEIQPFLVLAEEKGVPIIPRPDMPYQATGLIASVKKA